MKGGGKWCPRHGRQVIPFPYQPCTLSASLAVRLYCLRFAFAFTIDLKTESAPMTPKWIVLQAKPVEHSCAVAALPSASAQLAMARRGK
jgi:hypothetical protein